LGNIPFFSITSEALFIERKDMIEPSFNLMSQKWISAIPISRDANETVLLSLRGVFEQASQIQELHDDIPLVLPALLRLLLAVSHRAWQGQTRSERYEEWRQWWDQKHFPERLFNYLDEQEEKFYLFHPKYPFFQMAGLEVGNDPEKSRKSILCLLLNQANNPTLFDHNMEDSPPDFSPAQAARALLVGQSYLAGGTGGQDVEINGTAYKKPSSFFGGPLFNSAVIWLNGKTLFETLMLNLAPDRAALDGEPIWEKSVKEQIKEANDTRPATISGVLDRLTFQNRLLRLLLEEDEESHKVVIRRVLMAQGRRPGEIRDEMKAYYEDQKKGRLALRINAQKAVWRDSQIIFSSEQSKLGPAAFSHAARVTQIGAPNLTTGSRFKVSVVGLASDKAKVILWRHDRMPAPVALLDDPNAAGRIERAINYATNTAREILLIERSGLKQTIHRGEGRMWRVACLFCYPNAEHPLLELRPKEKDLDNERIAQIAKTPDPLTVLWSRLETPFHAFLLQLPKDAEGAMKKWMDEVEDQAHKAFVEARDSLGTSPRALATAAISSDFRRKERYEAETAQRLEKENEANKGGEKL
jgi:CRISPR system Cascade subunit CasA